MKENEVLECVEWEVHVRDYMFVCLWVLWGGGN